MKFLKYLKSLIYILVPILVFTLFLSLISYWNLIPSGIMNYIKLFIVALSMFIGGIYIGREASKRGWLEGIKVGLEVIFLLFLISYLAFDQGISLKTMIYYLILLSSSMLGSMMGINKKKTT